MVITTTRNAITCAIIIYSGSRHKSTRIEPAAPMSTLTSQGALLNLEPARCRLPQIYLVCTARVPRPSIYATGLPVPLAPRHGALICFAGPPPCGLRPQWLDASRGSATRDYAPALRSPWRAADDLQGNITRIRCAIFWFKRHKARYRHAEPLLVPHGTFTIRRRKRYFLFSSAARPGCTRRLESPGYRGLRINTDISKTRSFAHCAGGAGRYTLFGKTSA